MITNTANNSMIVDIGINLTHKSFRTHWKEVVQRAIDGGVNKVILTGTSVRSSRESLEMAQEWWEETGEKNIYATVGIHPHEAKTWKDDDSTMEELRNMLLSSPFAVAVGECGLDYNRNFSSREQQAHAFKSQIRLARELKKPMFVHEREAHKDFIKILDEVKEEDENTDLPPIVVHCFTGTKKEAIEYINRGYFIGFTGTICKKERGRPLRDIIPHLPLEKLMVETDAPFMGFKKGRHTSEPVDCVDVAKKLADTMNVPYKSVAATTTKNANAFFGLEMMLGTKKETQKSKNALRKERRKQNKAKKDEEAKVQSEEAAAAASAAAANNIPVDREKRARKLKKILRQIEDLKTKDPSELNEDQQQKLMSEKTFEEELAQLGIIIE